MNGGEPSAGTPPDSAENVLRALIDGALLFSGSPGSKEEDASGGVQPSRMLGDFFEQALRGLYEATGARADVTIWLADALGVHTPYRNDVVLALARLLDASASEPGPEFEVPLMSPDEDRADLEASRRAADAFGTIPDGQTTETP